MPVAAPYRMHFISDHEQGDAFIMPCPDGVVKGIFVDVEQHRRWVLILESPARGFSGPEIQNIAH